MPISQTPIFTAIRFEGLYTRNNVGFGALVANDSGRKSVNLSNSDKILNELSVYRRVFGFDRLIITLNETEIGWLALKSIESICLQNDIFFEYIPLRSGSIASSKHQLKSSLERLIDNPSTGNTFFLTGRDKSITTLIASALAMLIDRDKEGSARFLASMNQRYPQRFILKERHLSLLNNLAEEWGPRFLFTPQVEQTSPETSPESTSGQLRECSDYLISLMSQVRHHIVRWDLNALVDASKRKAFIHEVPYIANARTNPWDLLWILAVDDSGEPVLGGVIELGSESTINTNATNDGIPRKATPLIPYSRHFHYINLESVSDVLRVSVRSSSNPNIVMTGPGNWRTLPEMSELPPQSAALISCFLPEDGYPSLLKGFRGVPLTRQPRNASGLTIPTRHPQDIGIETISSEDYSIESLKREGEGLDEDALDSAIQMLRRFRGDSSKDSNSLFLFGYLSLRKGDFNEAVEALTRIAERASKWDRYQVLPLLRRAEILSADSLNAPTNHGESIKYARRESKSGNYRDSNDLIDIILAEDPSNQYLRRLQAYNFFKLKNYKASLNSYQHLLEDFDESAQILFLIGKCHKALGNSELSVDFYKRAWILDNDYRPSIIAWGTSFLGSLKKQHKLDFEIPIHSRYSPQDSEAFYKAICFLSVGQNEAVSDQLFRVRSMRLSSILKLIIKTVIGEELPAPTITEPLVSPRKDVGRSVIPPNKSSKEKPPSRSKKKAEDIERLLKEQSQEADRLGNHHFRKRAFRSAIKCFEEAWRLDKTNHKLMFRLAQSWRMVRNFENERFYYRLILEGTPNFAPALVGFAVSYGNQILEEIVIEDLHPFDYLDNLRDVDEGNPLHLFYLGLYYLAIGEFPRVEFILQNEVIRKSEYEGLLKHFIRHEGNTTS